MEVTLIDYMGDDLRVVNSARVSFKKEAGWDIVGTTEKVTEDGRVWSNGEENFTNVLSEGDQKLINYLATHNHWTPFSHVQITLREKVPIFVARQRFKHMVGFTYNEVSRRYVDDVPEFFVPTEWRKRAVNKKQGSSDEIIEDLKWEGPSELLHDGEPYYEGESIGIMYDGLIRHAEWLYKVMIDNGVAPEQARMLLPQAAYTEYYVTGSLAAWARAYKLRIDPHAQKEIQDLAKMWQKTIGNIKELEHSWKALTS